jgi:chromosome segregation ATPase
MSSLEKITKLKKQAAALQRDADKVSGALTHLKGELKEKHGCSSLKKAERLLARLKKEEKELDAQLEKETQSFVETYSDRFE